MFRSVVGDVPNDVSARLDLRFSTIQRFSDLYWKEAFKPGKGFAKLEHANYRTRLRTLVADLIGMYLDMVLSFVIRAPFPLSVQIGLTLSY